MKHELTHIPFKTVCTSRVKGKAQAEPHKRIERIAEDSELPDYLVSKDAAASSGLKVLSVCVKSFGYGTTIVETKGATGTFAVTWGVKMLICLGLSDIILRCDPKPSPIKWAASVKSERQERTVIRSSPRQSHQSNGAVENYQKQIQGEVTQYRPTTDSALMKWIGRHAAWLIPRSKGKDVQSPFYQAMGGPCRGRLLEFGQSVLAHLPEVEKDLGTPAPKLADRWKSAVWLGKNDLTDEHLVRTELYTVYAGSIRRVGEHSWTEENLRAVVETPRKPNSGHPSCS